MMTSPESSRAATYEDLAALPDNVVGEIIQGVLHATPRPSVVHANAASAILSDLRGPFQKGKGGPGGWLILIEPELHFAGDVLVPDLAGWRKERLTPALQDARAFKTAPDWVCEVLSPYTARIDRVQKMALYAQHDVPHVWLVDPIAKTLEAYQLHGAQWLLLVAYSSEEGARVPPFVEVGLDLAEWWLESW